MVKTGVFTELVAKGDQDSWTTGHPQVSFFKHSWEHYAPFVFNLEAQSIAVGNNGKNSHSLGHSMDMLAGIHLAVKLPALTIDSAATETNSYRLYNAPTGPFATTADGILPTDGVSTDAAVSTKTVTIDGVFAATDTLTITLPDSTTLVLTMIETGTASVTDGRAGTFLDETASPTETTNATAIALAITTFWANLLTCTSSGADITVTHVGYGTLANVACVAAGGSASVDGATFAGGTNAIGWIENTGHRLIKNIRLSIGSQTVQKLSGDFIFAYEELTGGNNGNKQTNGIGMSNGVGAAAHTLFINIPFWFCQENMHALPMVGLQFNDVQLHLECNPVNELIAVTSNGAVVTINGVTQTSSAVNYGNWGGVFSYVLETVYLGDHERAKIAGAQLSVSCPSGVGGASSEGLTCLIEQRQELPVTVAALATSFTLDVPFNHINKAWIWTFYDATKAATTLPIRLNAGNTAAGKYFEYDRVLRVEGLLNRNSRFGSINDAGYDENLFRQVSANLYWKNIPSGNIYNMSYSQVPSALQPSGSLNCSRINKVQFKGTCASSATDRVFTLHAISYNVLLLQNGTGGVKYNS